MKTGGGRRGREKRGVLGRSVSAKKSAHRGNSRERKKRQAQKGKKKPKTVLHEISKGRVVMNGDRGKKKGKRRELGR